MTAQLGSVQQEAAALVRRTRAGDQNAWALIKRVGEAVRSGKANAKAKAAYAAILKYLDSNPVGAKKSAGLFGADASSSASAPSAQALKGAFAPPSVDPEMTKPVLPRGFFDDLFDPDRMEVIIIRAYKYRHGVLAAAVVLASGPTLTKEMVEGMGLSSFGSDEATATFYHGVQFCGEADWKELASKLDPPSRRALAVGQCVGRAKRLQNVRKVGSRIGRYAAVAGWELGE